MIMLAKKNSSFWTTFQIPEDTLNSLQMYGARIMHELAHQADSISDIRPSMREIDQSSYSTLILFPVDLIPDTCLKNMIRINWCRGRPTPEHPRISQDVQHIFLLRE